MKPISTNKHWEDYWQSENHQPLVIHRELLDNLAGLIEVKGKNILEIGAGMGGDSFYLAEKGAKVTVLDFSRNALENISAVARKKNLKIKTVFADAKKIPFPDRSFDIVFHQGFLEHFRHPGDYLLEQKRVLKDRGVLLVDVPQRYTTYSLKKHWLMMEKKWFAGWEREFSINELEKLLEEFGFAVLKSYGWGYYGKLNRIRNLKLGTWYQKFWNLIERSRLKLYLNFSIGVIAGKV